MESSQLVERDTFLDPETEFLASKAEIGNEWELFKENVRPLKRGRNVRLLNHTLKSNSDFQLKNSLLHNRRSLIEAIDQYTGEDPLQPRLEKAQPVEKFTAAYRKFLTRTMRQLKAADEDATENQVPTRSFGTDLAKQPRNQVSESSDIFKKKQKCDRLEV